MSNDVLLWTVPSDANPNDVRLRDNSIATTGTLSITLDPITLTASGNIPVNGTLSVTLDAITVSGGWVTIVASDDPPLILYPRRR